MNDRLSLAAEFPPTDAAEWRKLVDVALKGASFEKRLVSQTYDGLRVEPLYPRAAGVEPVAGRKAGAAWTVTQRVDHPDPKAANAEALHDLENGATGLSLVFAGSIGAYGYGLDGSQAAIAQALDDVWLDAVSIDTDLSAQAKDAGLNLAKVIKARNIDPAKTQIRFGHDPLGLMARNGSAPRPWRETAPLLAGMAANLASQGFTGPFAAADGRAVHAAGGSEAQELAFVISNAIAYLRMFEHAGIALHDARKLIYFRLAADADEFLTIAKFRALRKLWARVEQASGLTPQPAFVGAETAWRMMTARDPYVNMLRTTIAVTAAGLGGADAVSVLPFTIARGLPDRFARRAARNQQLVLLEESNLFRVADPAAGSGAIETLTTQMAQSAWALVQEIEGAGGAPRAIEQGLLQARIARVREARQASIARRKEALTGTSDYPNLSEADVKVADVRRITVPPLPAAMSFDALPLMRLSEPFEALRDRSDAILARTGTRPKVFLATLGKLADFTPRAMFAKNFYEAGGIEALGNDGFKDQAAMIAAFETSGARLACLCGSDTAYAEQAVGAAKALREAGAIVHLAGRPGELETALKEAGVKTFVFMGADVLATLQATHDMIESVAHNGDGHGSGC
jgi:methylmalonyl-CoA mutase